MKIHDVEVFFVKALLVASISVSAGIGISLLFGLFSMIVYLDTLTFARIGGAIGVIIGAFSCLGIKIK